MALTNTEIEYQLRKPVPLSRLEASGNEGDVITLQDGAWVAAPPPEGGSGSALFSLFRLATIAGPDDDYVLIPLEAATLLMAEVWIPDHQTGELHFCSQAMINDAGGRQLRLGMRKGLAPAGAVDVVLAASA